jgi:excisionase family DNA binding protein
MTSDNYDQSTAQSELLNVQEVARMMRLKESTIRSWILKRKIPFVKLGRRVFVRRADAQDFINASVVYPTPVPDQQPSMIQ